MASRVMRGLESWKDFTIHTDVSRFEHGAVLSQADKEDHHTVTFLSGKLQASERHLASMEHVI